LVVYYKRIVNFTEKIEIMRTEREYLDAIKVIAEYTRQVKKQTEKALLVTGITKTPKEIGLKWDTYFPSMPIRLWNILMFHFADVRICDIKQKEFFSKRLAGKQAWRDLCKFTNNAD